jgi:cobalt/nickel transport system permease protein
MHIPDGYLAPQTTVPALAAMVPVWAVAFRKVKRNLSEKRVPALALSAAFAFVIMMFNVPVVGGSSAHAVGAVFISILLGPWAAVISVSTALLIQALVFGDGGILSFGMNCLNMAVIMPFSGYLAYRLICRGAKPGSTHSLAGAAVGSYIGINLAALCAAAEFGIQPLLFKAADGSALYCPYPLDISVPAMAFAHLLVAGPIEAVITTAAVAYIAKYAPQMFADTTIPVPEKNMPRNAKASFFSRYKVFVIPLIVIVVLTPLGLLATGSAWGEWSGEEIKKAIGYIPSGFAAMSDKWNALMPDYSLPVLGGSTAGSVAGYILSAIAGIVIIAALILLTSFLVRKTRKEHENT